jgi:hypothetical protein
MKYIKPEIEVVLLKDRLMLELPVSNFTVDDEAAKEGSFDDEMDWDSQESIWGKSSGKDQNWDEWSGN